MNVEAALIELVGEPAKKLHTARSRNDQVRVACVRIYIVFCSLAQITLYLVLKLVFVAAHRSR